MEQEKIRQYEEELFTETTEEGQATTSKKVFTANRVLDQVNVMKKEKKLINRKQIKYQQHLQMCRDRIMEVSPAIYDIIMMNEREVRKYGCQKGKRTITRSIKK